MNQELVRVEKAPLVITGEEEGLIYEKFGFTKKEESEFNIFLWEARHRRLHPLAGQIISIPRNKRVIDTETGQWKTKLVRQTQVTIDGFRLIAHQTGLYAGQEGPWWCGEDGQWVDVWLKKEPPAAAKVFALRDGFAKPMSAVANFSFYCVRDKNGDPANVWRSGPALMIAKCAEALALRKAFPEDLSGLYTNDEMMQADNDRVPDVIKTDPHGYLGDRNDEPAPKTIAETVGVPSEESNGGKDEEKLQGQAENDRPNPEAAKPEAEIGLLPVEESEEVGNRMIDKLRIVKNRPELDAYVENNAHQFNRLRDKDKQRVLFVNKQVKAAFYRAQSYSA
jgi:phage recombination protein Bet